MMIRSKTIMNDIVEIADEIMDDLEQLDGKNLLISGGAGFIGAYFLDTIDYANRNILKTPCKVYSIDNFITGSSERVVHFLKNSTIKIINADISKQIKGMGNVDYILHVAGVASPTYYRLHPLETIEGSVRGAWNLLELSRRKKIDGFLLFSSSEVYGDPTSENIPTPESYNGNVSFTGPRACYDEAKRFAETLCTTYRKLFNLPIKIVRPGNIYGPGMKLDDKRVIPDFFKNVLENEDITLLSDGSPTRCFCYITDAVIGFSKILFSNENTEFNISNDEQEISMLDLAKEVIRISGKNHLKINYQKSGDFEYLTDNPSRRHLDLTKARKILGYSPKVSLSEGLARTFAWYQEEYD
jgi:dTDP-glucose 4,6-dehydratase/UDP-glucuronate decarboxylase